MCQAIKRFLVALFVPPVISTKYGPAILWIDDPHGGAWLQTWEG